MICGSDGDRFETGRQPNDREDTEFWLYCKKCDTWTEFPINEVS